MSRNTTESIPAACGGPAKTKAAYRFFDNEQVIPEKIDDSHRNATLTRMREEEVVLIPQDTTVLNFSNQFQRKDKALIGDNGQIIISFMTSVEQNQLTDCIMPRANERYKSHYELNTLKGLLQELGLNPIMKCTYAGRLEQLRNANDIAEMSDIAHIPQEDYYVLTGHAPIAELDLSRVPEHNLHLMPKPQEQAQRCLVQ